MGPTSQVMAIALIVMSSTLLGNFSVLLILILWRLKHRRVQCAEKQSAQLPAKSSWLVVIPVLHEAAQLEKCLRASLTATPDSTTIIVVLDGKTIESVETCRAVVNRVNDSIRAKEPLSRRNLSCIPTSLILKEGSTRRKGEAINVVLSLCGKKALCTYDGQQYRIAVADNSSLDADHCSEASWEIVIPDANYLLCVDVDEQLTAAGFSTLRDAAQRDERAVLIQCRKHDQPVSGSAFAHSFSSAYAAWFQWEAAWPRYSDHTVNSTLGSSYYGSMAAIRLDPRLLEPTNLELVTGRSLQGVKLFPGGYRVDDYPLFLRKFSRQRCLFLETCAGSGESPLDAFGYLSLWERWALGNIASFRDNWQFILGIGSYRQSLSMAYHAASWYIQALFGLLPCVLSVSYLLSSKLALDTGILVLLVFLLQATKNILPASGTVLWQRMLRLPIEMLLWPVFLGAVCNPYSGGFFKSQATPRERVGGRIPIFLAVSYIGEGVLLSLPWVFELSHLHILLPVQLLVGGIVDVLVGIGLSALIVDRCYYSRSST